MGDASGVLGGGLGCWTIEHTGTTPTQGMNEAAETAARLAEEVPGAVLHHPDVRLGLSEADVVRPQAALVEVVRAAGRQDLWNNIRRAKMSVHAYTKNKSRPGV